MKPHFQMFAAYNRWANARIYSAAGELSDDDFNRDVGAVFKSAMGTLNHLLATDRIWLQRFTGQGSAPASLDAILFREFVELDDARTAEDSRIIAWVGSLSDQDLTESFSYSPITDPTRIVTQRLAPALAHLFNHHAHHRGQVHTILTMLGKPSVAVDLIYFQRTEEGRAFA